MPERLTVEQTPLGDLRPYPGNARRGDVDAIAESMRVNGQYAPLVVQRSTGHVLVGNHRLRAAQKLGWPSVQVTYLDVDDEGARRIVLADNRTADLGSYDEPALLALLRDLGEDLSGTGYDAEDFDALLASLDEAPDEPPPSTPSGREPAARPSGPPPPEYEEAYSSKAARFLTLNYPLARYVWIMERLTALAEEEGVPDVAAAVLRLVETWTGDTAPAEDDEPQTAPAAPAVNFEEATVGA